jgi:hypothetical protein
MNKTFRLKKQHTCKPGKNVSRDASIIMTSKKQGVANPLLSAREVVEREMMAAFTMDPTSDQPVRRNLIRVVQRKKMAQFLKNPIDLHFN